MVCEEESEDSTHLSQSSASLPGVVDRKEVHVERCYGTAIVSKQPQPRLGMANSRHWERGPEESFDSTSWKMSEVKEVWILLPFGAILVTEEAHATKGGVLADARTRRITRPILGRKPR